MHSGLQANHSYLLGNLKGSFAVISSTIGDLTMMSIDHMDDTYINGTAHFTNRPHAGDVMNQSQALGRDERCTFLVDHHEAIFNSRARRLFESLWDGSFRYRGNWCGPGWANGAWISERDPIVPTVEPEDCCDGACMAHDTCISDSYLDRDVERMKWCNAEMAEKMYSCYEKLPWWKKWNKRAGCWYMQFIFSILRSPVWCGGTLCSDVLF